MEEDEASAWRMRLRGLLDDVDTLRDLGMTGRAKWEALRRAFGALHEACMDRIQVVENVVLENRLSCLKDEEDAGHEHDTRADQHARAERELGTMRRMVRHAEEACVWAQGRLDKYDA